MMVEKLTWGFELIGEFVNSWTATAQRVKDRAYRVELRGKVAKLNAEHSFIVLADTEEELKGKVKAEAHKIMFQKRSEIWNGA